MLGSSWLTNNQKSYNCSIKEYSCKLYNVWHTDRYPEHVGEGEYVAFDKECVCEGPVEVWLQNVVDSMRSALSAEFKAAMLSYDEKPRGKWLFDYSAQNTVVVSRTYFTADINTAFEDLEEGNEDALKVFLLPIRNTSYAKIAVLLKSFGKTSHLAS